ncbi:MAG TPA: cell division ATP-binding protein FtsE [Nitrosomonas sp.]|nr:cell division ATP-binding protein FtsE [Nitrosomonas sp.]HMW20266.1 cell division ATP-binding protein FtsE [Nitrosomonas sp.]HMW69303.1 cell division ATP-binding protein FtsE [Nitrosomonas sp.]HMY60475.1 cell division ATP-binding protein FtsE [Nitrosomonas sp.]HMY90296.1 cell division ATP-binding protein FtsE [Nitrosomonas sp.]
MITFDKVYKRYPDGYEALTNLIFTIDTGEMVFITGHSGAGKSTLLKLIAAIEKPTSGSITVSDQIVNKLKKSMVPFLRRSLGIIFQDQKILYDRTVFANVMLPLQIHGFEKSVMERRVRAALDKVGLLNKEKAYPITLSGGEKQRLCIARAVVHRPLILIADEPTANLDVAYAQNIMDVFRSFHQVGVTVLIATHDQTILNDSTARILSLNQGHLMV